LLQRILAYKFDSSAQPSECAQLLWQHSLQYPIHSLLALDLTGDGLKDLAVLSLRGIHILQVNEYSMIPLSMFHSKVIRALSNSRFRTS